MMSFTIPSTRSLSSNGGGEGPGLEPIYDAIDLVYQVVEQPEWLASALGAVARVLGVDHAVLVHTGAGGERRVIAAGHAERGHAVSALERTPSGGYRSFESTRTVPLGSGHELILDAAELADPALAALLRLTPHLSRVLRLVDRFPQPSGEGPGGAGALDRVRLGVVLLDAAGRVLVLNRAARTLASSSALIGVREGRLVPSQSVPRVLFETLVDCVTAPAAGNRRLVGGELELIAPGRATIRLVVAPHHVRRERDEGVCAVLLSSPGVVPGPEEVLVERHHLSVDEARVGAALIAGRDPVAALSELEPLEVRALQERLFAALGSTRQSDLVRLLLRPPGVLYAADDG
jgi:hypothetical protein